MLSPLFTFLILATGFLLLNSFVGGGILRISVQLHNRLAMDMRYDRLVVVPSLSTAFGMMLAINTLLFVFSLAAQISLGAVGFRLGWITQVTGVVSIVIFSEAIMMTWLVGVVLQATWFRALVVATIHLMINLLIVSTIVGTIAFVTYYE